jgi:hypothetical protein
LDGIERLTHDPYTAALVAQHRLHVCRQYADASEWHQFFDVVREVLEIQLHDAGLESLDQLLVDYAFVRAVDLASLAFCNNWTKAADPDGRGYTMRLDRTTLRIAPDPFDTAIGSYVVEVAADYSVTSVLPETLLCYGYLQ